MRIRTLLLYLIGNRNAILTLAAQRRTLIFGLLFVLSAGFAREYDGEDLTAEPWHVVLPIGASLIASLLLFLITWGIAAIKDAPMPPFVSAYLGFLGLFWLTAPLAWLYAVPYERFLSPAAAVQANLLTLGVVSTWRVALMIRVVHVLMGYKLWHAVVLVLAFADVVALAVLSFLPFPIIEIMGGVRMTESERLLRNTAGNVCCLGSCSLPCWLIGVWTVCVCCNPAWHRPEQAPSITRGSSWLMTGLACAAMAIWFFILPWTQPEQRLRGRVERALQQGRIAEALAEMSDHQPEEYPPHWDPPPHSQHDPRSCSLLEVLWVMAEAQPAPWVRAVYLEKLERSLHTLYTWKEEELMEIAYVLYRLPEGSAFVEKFASTEKPIYSQKQGEQFEEYCARIAVDPYFRTQVAERVQRLTPAGRGQSGEK